MEVDRLLSSVLGQMCGGEPPYRGYRTTSGICAKQCLNDPVHVAGMICP